MSEMIKPLYILLPICTQTKHDVFFNVLKPIIARSKVDDHYLDNAFKLGLMGDIRIELEDITTNWDDLVSREQQIRQSKILGYWAIKNFPLLGKKIFGGTWKPPTRGSFPIVENSNEIILTEDDIDELVLKKLKLRMLQLNVSKSTSAKLKHFIVNDLPINIGKNECQISPKIKSFDVDGECTTNFWEALKLGKFSSEFNFEKQVDENPKVARTQSLPQQEIEERPQIVSTRKRSHQDTLEVNVTNDKTMESDTDEANIDTGSPLVHTSKRANVQTLQINVTNGNTMGSNGYNSSIDYPSVSAPEGEYLDDVNNGKTVEIHNGETSIDTIHEAIVELRKEIVNLSSSALIDRQSLQIMIINPKDEEISRLKSTIQEMRQTNENFMADKLILKDQVEKQTALIHALQQGVDATSKLHGQCERDAAKKDEELDSLKNAYKELHDELNQFNGATEFMLGEWKDQIGKLEADIAASEKYNSEANERITKLQDELNVSQTYSVSKDDQLRDAMATLNELRVQIDILSPDKSDIQTQTDACIESHNEVSTLKMMLAEKEKELNSTKETYEKHHDELSQLDGATAGMVGEWKYHIEKLETDLATAEKYNSEANHKIKTLREELNVSRTYAASKDDQLNELRVQIELLSPDKCNIETQSDQYNESHEELSASGKTPIQKLALDLATAAEVNCQTIDPNAKFREDDTEMLNDSRQIELSSPAKSDIQTETVTCNQLKQEQKEEPNHTSMSIEHADIKPTRIMPDDHDSVPKVVRAARKCRLRRNKT